MEDILKQLQPLRGVWQGRGTGDYPTIERFDYWETLRFEFAASYPLFHYEQRTTLTDGEPSHWESGFLRPLEGGRLELSNAQDSGRVEVLLGRIENGPGDELTLAFASTLIGHDERVVETRRIWRLAGERLSYVMQMSTRTTEAVLVQQHLEASLARVPDLRSGVRTIQ